MMRIKAITLWEPWGTLIALGEKLYETRGWATNYRGPLAIHVARRWKADQDAILSLEPFRSVLAKYGFVKRDDFSLGHVVAVAELTGVYRTVDMRASLEDQEMAFGNYGNGRYAWKLSNVRRLSVPVLATGKQGLWWWDVPVDLASTLSLQENKA